MKKSLINNVKDILADILKERSLSPVNIDDLSIDYETDLDEQMEKYLMLLHEQERLLRLAKKQGDEQLMLSSLLRLRTHAMSLSTFFDAIVEDTEIILKLDSWPEIPEK